MLGILFQLLVLTDVGATDESMPADAIYPESIKSAIVQLDNPSFQRREEAVQDLIALGFNAIIPAKEAAESVSPEVSVRAFEILLRFYRSSDEQIYDAVEKAMRQLMHASDLAISARAERFFESITDIRRPRGVAKFIRLGGVIHFEDPIPERHYILIGRDWRGSDEDVRLVECIPQVHETLTQLIVVRGAKISDEAIFELSLGLPLVNLQRRGPARLGVRSSTNVDHAEGCVIDFVEPESAADIAGLQNKDRVLRIDDEPIDDFKKLVEVIEKKEPGDRVPIIFERDGRVQNVVAELLPWK
jgi:hypothetical protein